MPGRKVLAFPKKKSSDTRKCLRQFAGSQCSKWEPYEPDCGARFGTVFIDLRRCGLGLVVPQVLRSSVSRRHIKQQLRTH
jgi:hypothetical protein